jgi:hypothetical protein
MKESRRLVLPRTSCFKYSTAISKNIFKGLKRNVVSKFSFCAPCPFGKILGGPILLSLSISQDAGAEALKEE